MAPARRRRGRRHERQPRVAVSTEDAGTGGCPVAHDRLTSPHRGRRRNQGWWPKRLNLKILAKNPPVPNPMGAGFDYAAAFEQPRPRRGQARHRRGADRLAGLVAGRLRPLRPAS